MSRLRFDLQSTPRPLPGAPLPMTFNQFGLDFRVRRAEPALAAGPATS